MRLHNRLCTFFIALLILVLAGCASSGTQKRAGGYNDDAIITTKVKAAILNEPNIKATEISVETHKGMVQLGGFVNSVASARRAVEIARSVKGVKSVQNNMSLK